MKKWIGTWMLLFIALLILCKTYQYDIENPKDFKVQQYFFFHGENFIDTRLNVIACVTDYDTDKMMYKIKRYYDAIYGEADRLTIILFHNIEDFENYDKCTEQTFYKHSLTITLWSG